MRIHVHDFSGHPFQVQLSRALARRGHLVRHTYAAEYTTGRGRLDVGIGDPEGLEIAPLRTGLPFEKYDPVKRVRFEIVFARALIKEFQENPCDVAIICNVPLFSLSLVRTYLARKKLPWVFWHQDIYSLAMTDEIARKLPPPVARVLGKWVVHLEKRAVSSAQAVVAIASSFVDQYSEWGLSSDHVRIIPNWSPIDEIVPMSKVNRWADTLPEVGLRLVYAGTLGRKHNPQLLLDLLSAGRARALEIGLVLVSEGDGAEFIRGSSSAMPNVTIHPFQSAEDLPLVLASADVLVAILEPEASRFSVPSKVASSLAAGRPTLLLAPTDNPAAIALVEAGGLALPPKAEELEKAIDWLVALRDSPELMRQVGADGRLYAERHYDVTLISAEFEQVLQAALESRAVL